MALIEFVSTEHVLANAPHPIPASKGLPEWFKRMPRMAESGNEQTVKTCMPFLDAMSTGYLIPAFADLHVETINGELAFGVATGEPPVSPHSGEQIKGCPAHSTPFGDSPFKFINPWVIKTPPGWSCLFMTPANHSEDRFSIVTGIVDTDTYHNQINFPAVWLKEHYKGVIARGTPLVQVIPFQRATVNSSVRAFSDDDTVSHKRFAIGTPLVEHFYRHCAWQPKKYR